jgi:hypothetical protein
VALATPNRLLICEGYEDAAFLERLITVKGLPQAIIVAAGGNTAFRSALNDFRVSKTKQFNSLEKILFVADNDEDPNGRFVNLCSQIDEVFGKGTAPKRPLEKSPPKRDRRAEISILMIPWEGERGHLEKMCVEAARDANRQIGSHVDTFLDLIVASNWNNESRHGKAWLRTNLAARCEKDPFVALGTVFDDPKYQPLIPVNHQSFNRIADVLREL